MQLWWQDFSGFNPLEELSNVLLLLALGNRNPAQLPLRPESGWGDLRFITRDENSRSGGDEYCRGYCVLRIHFAPHSAIV